MYYSISDNNHPLRYNPLKAIVSPRPIAWISTLDIKGRANLAPYSFFNAMSDMPSIIGFSSGPVKIGLDETKDTITNIKETAQFCVNIVSDALKHQMNISSGNFPYGHDEFIEAGVSKATSRMIKPPYVKEAPVAMECTLHDIIKLPGGSQWVIGMVVGIHIKDEYIVDGRLDVTKYRPVARLGYKDYTTVSDTYELSRAK